MNGSGVIVFRLNNGHHDHHEHTSVIQAKAEAHRLANTVGGRFVVYAPIAIIERTPPTHELPVHVTGVLIDEDADLPF